MTTDRGTVLRLPLRQAAADLLAMLPVAEREAMLVQLLDTAWELSEKGDLSNSIATVIRDWIVHAYFENDPVTQERLKQVLGVARDD